MNELKKYNLIDYGYGAYDFEESEDGEYYNVVDVDPKIKELKAERERLRTALEKIANTDYRGNRSTESVIAFNALNQKEKP